MASSTITNTFLVFFMVWVCDLVLFSNSEPFVIFFIAFFLFFSSTMAYFQHATVVEMRVNSEIREIYFLLESLVSKFNSIKVTLKRSGCLFFNSDAEHVDYNNPSIIAISVYKEYARCQFANSFIQFNSIVFSALMKQLQSVLKLEFGNHYFAVFNYLGSGVLDLFDYSECSDSAPISVIRPFNFSVLDKFFVCAYLLDSIYFVDLVSASPDGFYDFDLFELFVFVAIVHRNEQ